MIGWWMSLMSLYYITYANTVAIAGLLVVIQQWCMTFCLLSTVRNRCRIWRTSNGGIGIAQLKFIWIDNKRYCFAVWLSININWVNDHTERALGLVLYERRHSTWVFSWMPCAGMNRLWSRRVEETTMTNHKFIDKLEWKQLVHIWQVRAQANKQLTRFKQQTFYTISWVLRQYSRYF